MKYLFAVSVSALCVLTGIKKSRALSENRRLYMSLIDFLSECERQIEYYESTVYEIIRVCSERDELENLTFIKECLNLMSVFDFPVAWETSVRSFISELKKDETELLVSFGKRLGTSDCREQLIMISRTKKDFIRSYDVAAEKEEKNKKLYMIFSVSMGLIFFLMII